MIKKQAVNPYLPTYEYVPDGEPHVFGNRLYIFGSHDRFGGDSFCLNDYVCWSAPVTELAEWRYEGIIYRKDQDEVVEDPSIHRLFAPDVQRGPDGRFYLYYALDFTGIIAVAVCNEPAGKYSYYGHVRHHNGELLGHAPEDFFAYDPGVFVDSDGHIYLYSGFCPVSINNPLFSELKLDAPGAVVYELESDMVTIKKEARVVVPCKRKAIGTSFEGHAFFEASSMRKIGLNYYFIYSSEHGHELCYAVSTNPVSDFHFGGTLISNGDVFYHGRKQALNHTGTNHGSIELINSQYYVFWHRQTNRTPFSRQGCAECISINDDGTIEQVECTSQGLNGKPLIGLGTYSASIACNLLGKQGFASAYAVGETIRLDEPYFTQTGEDRNTDPDQFVAGISDGCSIVFKYFSLDKTRGISVHVKSTGSGILILTNGNEQLASFAIFPSQALERSAGLCSSDLKAVLCFTYYGNGELSLYNFSLT